MPPLSVNTPLTLLQESQTGAIRSPVTLRFTTCPPTVGLLEHPRTEHSAGHLLPEKFTQCCIQLPQAQALPPVPPLLDQPVAGILITVSFGTSERLEALAALLSLSISLTMCLILSYSIESTRRTQ
jgi:hypothetical protein